MKKLICLVCVCSALCISYATTLSQDRNLTAPPPKCLCTVIARGPVLYENKASWIKSAKLKLIGQYQVAAVSPNGANQFQHDSGGKNYGWRRAYLGADIVFGDGSWRLSNLTNVGDLEGRHSMQDGDWRGSHTTWSLFELYLEKSFTHSKFRVGKIMPPVTAEYALASSQIKTVERSALCNELVPVSNWGLECKLEQNKLQHSYGLYLNANGEALKDEWQFNNSDNLFLLSTFRYKLDSVWWNNQVVGCQYSHNFSTWRGQKVPDWSDYCGTGAQDIISLYWEGTKGDFSLMANAMIGAGILAQPGAKNVYGVVLQPCYRLTPHLEAVLQYQYAFGHRSVKLNSRYVPNVTRYPGWVDQMQSVYVGFNYYLCPESINALKLMLAVEYVQSHLDSARSKGFNGWTVFAAARFKF